jgi:hypothetical protein
VKEVRVERIRAKEIRVKEWAKETRIRSVRRYMESGLPGLN